MRINDGFDSLFSDEYSVTLSNPFVEGDKVARDKQLDSQVNYEISNVDGVVSMPYNDVVDIKDELVSNASDEQFPGSNWNEDSFDWISSSCSDNSEEMSGTSGTGTSNKKQPKKVYNSKSCKKPGAKVTCKICNKSLSTKQVLRHHISSVHANNRKLFTCKVCGRSHTTEVAHFRHLGAVHRIKEYWRFHCPMEGCEKGFYRNFDLKNHLNSHQEEAQFKCEICGKILRNRNAYNRHKRSHQGNLYQCNLCPDIFSRHDYLKNHVTKCHPDGKSGPGSSKRQNIKCEHCGWSFGQEWRYKHHLTVVHGVPDNEKLLERKQERKKTVEKREKKETVKRPRNKVTEPKSNTCSICQKIFSCNQARRYHVISVHEKKLQGFCELCGILVTNFKYHKAVAHGDGKNNRKIKEMTPKEKVKKMNREEKEAMKLERKGVTQSMIPSTCPTCLKVFSSKGAQQLHVNTIHEKKLQGFCDLCGRVFCSSRYLKRHKELVHENRSNINQRNLPCSVEGCSRMFYTKYQMSLHVKAVHEGNPQFQCEQCGKKLIDVTKLKRHIEAMHTNRESKPYKCDICGKGFATKDYVWLHKKTHQAKAKTNDQDSQGNGIGS